MFSGLFSWFKYPIYSEGDAVDWFAGLVLILVLSFLWTLVIRKIVTD